MENIVFIHLGTSSYVQYSLACARIFNPNHNIWYISDQPPAHNVSHLVNYVPISTFTSAVAQIKKFYLHMAHTEVVYERFCLERWIILREFSRQNNINRVCYFDSDVLIFEDVANGFDSFKNYDFTLSRGMAGHCSFWNSIDALSGFCDFFMGYYLGTNEELIEGILDIARISLKSGNPNWGISDMYFLSLFAETGKWRFADSIYAINGSMFDNNMNCWDEMEGSPSGFVKDPNKDLKKIMWKNGFPYATYAQNQELVKMNSLHFQGEAKFDIPEYFTVSSYSLQIADHDFVEHSEFCKQINAAVGK